MFHKIDAATYRFFVNAKIPLWSTCSGIPPGNMETEWLIGETEEKKLILGAKSYRDTDSFYLRVEPRAPGFSQAQKIAQLTRERDEARDLVIMAYEKVNIARVMHYFINAITKWKNDNGKIHSND